jgi:hypothetical protein
MSETAVVAKRGAKTNVVQRGVVEAPRKVSDRKKFIAIVEGVYITTVDKQLTTRPYRLAFQLQGAYRPLSRIKKYLLMPALQKKYPDVSGVYRCVLIALYDPADPTNYVGIDVDWLGEAQLARYVEERSLPVPIEKIAKLEDKRDLVKEYEQCARENNLKGYELYLARIEDDLKRKMSIGQTGFDAEKALEDFEKRSVMEEVDGDGGETKNGDEDITQDIL